MYNIHEAKTRFSHLIERAESGESIVIARAGKPVARLVPYRTSSGPRKPGILEGDIWISPDFDETSADVIDEFEGSDS